MAGVFRNKNIWEFCSLNSWGKGECIPTKKRDAKIVDFPRKMLNYHENFWLPRRL